MKSTDIPLNALTGSFLKACSEQAVEAVVWTKDTLDNGRENIASNKGEEGVGKARARLTVKDGGIEAAAKALHEFRFFEEGKTAVEPNMDFCGFLFCAGANVGGQGGGTVPWDSLPNEVKELHRTVVKTILGNALRANTEATKPLVSV